MDLAVFNFFYNLADKSFALDILGIFLANYLPYLMILAAITYILFKEDHWQMKIFSGIFILLSSILARSFFTRIIREFIQRPRPFETLGLEPLIRPVTEMSFPSGHASLLFGLAFAILFFNRKWGWWFIALAFVNGLARIFTGIHWPTDIIAGIAVGALSFFVIYFLLEKPYKILYKKEGEPTENEEIPELPNLKEEKAIDKE